MRPTTPSRFGTLARTRSSNSEWRHYFIAYQKFHEHSLTEVSGPGAQDQRSKYWWRRVMAVILPPNTKFFYRDNIYQEEQAIVFTDPVPGGHGDRFTHSFAWIPGPNSEAMYALKAWEKRNLTPEQLAAKYGVYVPRMPVEDRIVGWCVMVIIWSFLLIHNYTDSDTGFITHPVIDDFVRELGGITPLREGEEALDQWVHPWHHSPNMVREDPRHTWKPISIANTKQ